jgi:hypothetical protein
VLRAASSLVLMLPPSRTSSKKRDSETRGETKRERDVETEDMIERERERREKKIEQTERFPRLTSPS